MEQNKSKDNVLYVKMFGSFSMIYAGESVLGNKVSETQFTYMMQILLHNRKKWSQPGKFGRDAVRRPGYQEYPSHNAECYL